MPKTLDYYFTPVSPWTYLGHDRFTHIAAKHGAAVRVKPVDYGRIFPVSGGLPLKSRAPQRQAYRLVELARFRDHLGIPLNVEPRHFPVDPTPAAVAIIAADAAFGAEAAMRLAGGCLRAVWAEERDIADTAEIAAIALEQGVDAQRLMRAEAAAAARAKFDAYTEEAIARGVFGAPSYVLDGEIFWGQDRLEFLDRALGR
ncbi:MAG: 2-hydroxychromene-2-carboxylate isomerase [Burkholderiales bacterium]|nr:2-hydroxychromene-2-carboxylate isomerase [Burkholderiales bacterium]